MKVFVDTSGLLALLVRNDQNHSRAKKNFMYFAEKKAQLFTSSFVLVETTALIQKRIGFDPLYEFNSKLLSLLDVVWVNKDLYNRALQRLLVQKKRSLSLVDCVSFEIMTESEISLAFTFDKHFDEFGFETI